MASDKANKYYSGGHIYDILILTDRKDDWRILRKSLMFEKVNQETKFKHFIVVFLFLIFFMSATRNSLNYCLKTSLKNEQIFPGSLNPLLYVRSFQTTWTCLFELTWYPFGTQRCTIEMYTFHENIDILPETIKYSGKLFDSLMCSQLNPSLNVSCKVLSS